MIQSAHDVSDGGLLVALAESSLQSGLGVAVDLETAGRLDAQLFGEAQSRIVISASPDQVEAITAAAAKAGVAVSLLGTVQGTQFRVERGGEELVDLPVGTLAHHHAATIPSYMS